MRGSWVPETAAYLNGASGHALDFDDHNDALGGHPTAAVLPAVLAVAEETHASLKSAMSAYIIGLETAIALGRVMNPAHYEHGWHPTATLGILSATVASSRLLGLDPDSTTRALSIATAFASGMKSSFGSAVKPLQVGFASSKAVTAAHLAKVGLDANIDVFDGAYSFARVFDGPDEVDWSPLNHLGEWWMLADAGLDIKLYPCCVSTQSPVLAAIALRTRETIDLGSIRRVDVFVHPRRMGHIDDPHPRGGAAARFSVQYAVALALLRGELRIADFTDAGVAENSDVRHLQYRVRLHALEPGSWVIPEGRSDCFSSRVEVTDDGGTHSTSVAGHRGYDHSDPVRPQELTSKYLALTQDLIGPNALTLLDSLSHWQAKQLSAHELLDQIQGGILHTRRRKRES